MANPAGGYSSSCVRHKCLDGVKCHLFRCEYQLKTILRFVAGEYDCFINTVEYLVSVLNNIALSTLQKEVKSGNCFQTIQKNVCTCELFS